MGLNITESSSSFTPDIADTEPEIADTETATFAPDFVSFDTLENGVLTQLSENICLEDGILTQFYGFGVAIEEQYQDSLDSFAVLLSQGDHFLDDPNSENESSSEGFDSRKRKRSQGNVLTALQPYENFSGRSYRRMRPVHIPPNLLENTNETSLNEIPNIQSDSFENMHNFI